MLTIRAVKIEIQTPDGEFGAFFRFSKGLNVVRGDNTTGKSTVFQAILYALGMEELLGGRNAQTMQSALRDTLNFPSDMSRDVLESKVFLEIENEETVTLERVIKGQRSVKIIRVHSGSRLTDNNSNIKCADFWLHDKGGAKNEEYGFHRFLEGFLGWNLPDVLSTQGEVVKLYIQTIFPAFVVEQKAGWSDFLATVPFFAIRDAASQAVQFLLQLDIFDNARKKQQLRTERESIILRWHRGISTFEKLRDEISVIVKGIPSDPEIISSKLPVSVDVVVNGTATSLPEHIEKLREQVTQMESVPIPTVGESIDGLNLDIQQKNIELDQLILESEVIGQAISLKKERESQYRRQLEAVRGELQHNKDVQKIYNLGGEAQLSLARHVCPTCNQSVEDTLYMQDIHLTPMNIEENIRYVEAQEKMIATYLENEQRSIKNDETEFRKLNKMIEGRRKDIRDLKTELISGEHTLSLIEIENRLNLRKSVGSYSEIFDGITSTVSDFFELSEAWRKLLTKEKRLPKGDLSPEDWGKVNDLETIFRNLLGEFGYTSKAEADVSISKDRVRKFLLPVAQKDQYTYNIRFDSSGSDLIRAIWAYYFALFEVSKRHQTNHPRLLMFDEPIQQDVADSSTNNFMRRLENETTGQIFVFAAFGNSQLVYEEVMNGVTKANVIEVESMTLRPV